MDDWMQQTGMTELSMMASQLHEIFISLVAAGFNDDQALALLQTIVASNYNNQR